MRRLVRHDVVGETCVDRTAGRAGEISEEQAAVFLRIKSIRFGECMRGDVQLVPFRTPCTAAPERKLEASEDPHRYRVSVLCVEFRILEECAVEGRRGFRAERCLRVGIEIGPVPEFVLGRVIEDVVGGVVVDDVDPVAAGPGQELFGGNLHFRRENAPADPDQGILCDNGQLPGVRKIRRRSSSGYHACLPRVSCAHVGVSLRQSRSVGGMTRRPDGAPLSLAASPDAIRL